MLALLATVLLYALHQDFWFWREARPLVFGFLPIGLFYHAVHGRDLGTAVGARANALARAPRGRLARMIPAVVVFVYLGAVLAIGLVARTRVSGTSGRGGLFLAGRSLGPAVFLLSLFGANMTAFSILGASGHAFANGIVTYGLMASSSRADHPASASSSSARACGRSASGTAS